MTYTQNRDRQSWLNGYWFIMTNPVWTSASTSILTAGLKVLRKDRNPKSRGKASAVIALIREGREQAEQEAAEARKLLAGQLSMFGLSSAQDTQYESIR
ncbi:hypothetical protein SOV_17150 [Sporomusa ovata DSM 2662]|uniref:Uncharacterized protein n=1 Tax=Sporomusa ovata TaxID=2378 RepID=A0A0U1KVJ4_9FIRM|nr:hypothetical protein [Sporomusa ovata]EQB29315.1 hypothetical protein SOV_1c10480 [Sporomusa ovata DSM 2662]CQR71356.1 hypothetical protein SpAn4DRAFT_3861 [Sporomusa ovata]